MGFDGKKERVGHLVFPVTEESITPATKLPWEGDRWHKHWFVPQGSHNFSLKPEFRHMTGRKGFHRSWIKPKYLIPLMVIIHFITCEGKFRVFNSCYLRLLAHFIDKKYLNFPFLFLRSLEKMLNQVRKNTVNPKGSIYHHSLIKLLILDQLKEWNQAWDTFIFKVLNPHLNIRKHTRHINCQESNPSPLSENKIPNVVHLDDDTLEASLSTHFVPVSSKFIPLSRPRTRDQKAKFVQFMV